MESRRSERNAKRKRDRKTEKRRIFRDETDGGVGTSGNGIGAA